MSMTDYTTYCFMCEKIFIFDLIDAIEGKIIECPYCNTFRLYEIKRFRKECVELCKINAAVGKSIIKGRKVEE